MDSETESEKRETETQRDRATMRHWNREMGKHRGGGDRETERPRDRETERQIDRETEIQRYKDSVRATRRQRGRTTARSEAGVDRPPCVQANIDRLGSDNPDPPSPNRLPLLRIPTNTIPSKYCKLAQRLAFVVALSWPLKGNHSLTHSTQGRNPPPKKIKKWKISTNNNFFTP